MHVHRAVPMIGRVNPLVPAVVVLAGAATYIVGYRWIGAGISVGALLAFLNGVLLSERVEVAADMGDLGRALLVMQLGLLVTATVIGLATIVLIHFSLSMAVASAFGFIVTQMAIIGTFYFTRARSTRMENAA
jgi:hypothetical protein